MQSSIPLGPTNYTGSNTETSKCKAVSGVQTLTTKLEEPMNFNGNCLDPSACSYSDLFCIDCGICDAFAMLNLVTLNVLTIIIYWIGQNMQ
jgi:hypothetical protein